MKQERERFFVAQEDTKVFNVFSTYEFDEDGWLDGYSGREGYNIEDYDIVYWTDSFDDACAFADEMMER